MAARKVLYLTRRGDIFYFRHPLPKDVQPQLGRVEISLSLRTRAPQRARLLVAHGVLGIQRLCAKVRAMSLPSEEQARQLVVAFAQELLASAPAPEAFGSGRQEDDRDWVESSIHDSIAALRGVIEHDDYFGEGEHPVDEAAARVRLRARRVVDAAGVNIDELPDGARLLLLQGVARALIEEHLQFLHRANDRVTPYVLQDPMFRVVAPQRSVGAVSAVSQGPLLGEAIDAYIAAKKGVSWSLKTAVDYERVLRWVGEHFGADTPLNMIAKEHIREWRDLLLTVRKNAPPKLPFKSVTASVAGRRVGRKTSRKHFGVLAAAFSWWVDEGFLDTSPVGRITVPIPKATPGARRSPFKPEELQTLFSSPMYVGCASAKRRMTPGPKQIRDDYYWVPLIGVLSGMRLGEITQLGMKDIEIDADIPVIHIRADEATGGTVKSKAGWRDVPVHRRVVELGLLDFVRTRQTAKKKQARLFHAIPYGSDGSPSAEYSRWFSRRLLQIKLKRPDLVFHSFRHSFIDALREVSAPEYVLKALVGHEQGSVTDGYGHGTSLAAKKEWLDRVTLLDDLLQSGATESTW